MTMMRGPRRSSRRTIILVAVSAVLLVAGVVGVLVLRPGPGGPAGVPATAPATTMAGSNAAPTTGLPGYPVLKVVDGDTLHVLVDGVDETVRIIGINAAETDQCWGGEATDAARRLLEGTTVTLIADPTQADRDRYGRLLRYVVLPDGTDVGLRMISDGDADEYTYDDPYANQQEYRAAGAAASAGGQGRWNVATCDGNPTPSGTPTEPTGESGATDTVQTGPNGCDIKGNISANGKIYHLPGSADYDRTRIDESKGERWFCSIAEAQAAGWRARN